MGVREKQTCFEFVMEPASATAKLKRNCSDRPLSSRRTPRIICDVELNSIPLELSDRQYECAIAGARSLHELHKNRQFWKWRPSCSVLDNAQVTPNHNSFLTIVCITNVFFLLQLWWQYAIACHRERIHDRNDSYRLSTVWKKCRDNVLYVSAFKSYLRNPVAMESDLKAHKDLMDQNRGYDELKILREVAVYQLRKEQTRTMKPASKPRTPNPETTAPAAAVESASESAEASNVPEAARQSLLMQYLPLSWSGGWTSSSPEEDSNSYEVDNQQGDDISLLEEEIIEVLADQTRVTPYKDLVFAQLSVNLKQGALRLYTRTKTQPYSNFSLLAFLSQEKLRESAEAMSERQLLCELEFNDMRAELETRPRTCSYKFGLSLGAVLLRDCVTRDSLFPLLISPQQSEAFPPRPSGSNKTPLFSVLYETRPFSAPKTDVRLHLHSRSLNIVFNPEAFHRIANFFRIPEEINRRTHLAEKIRLAAYSRLEEAKQRTKDEFLRTINAVMERKKWDVLCDLSAPQILVPEDFCDGEALITVLDFGKLYISNSDTIASEGVQEKAQPEATNDVMARSAVSTRINDEDDNDEDDYDDFCTPASSPGTPPISPIVAPSLPGKISSAAREFTPPASTFTKENFVSKMYDAYVVSLVGMQVRFQSCIFWLVNAHRS